MAQVSGAQRKQAEAEGGDLPQDMQIGFSGKGSGIYGSFGTPAPSARPTPQVIYPLLAPPMKCSLCWFAHILAVWRYPAAV